MKRWQPFLTTLTVVATIWVTKSIVNLVVPIESPFLLFFSAIIFSAWRGGTGQGLFATLISLTFIVVQPGLLRGETPFSLHNMTRIVLFILDGVSIAYIGGAFQRVKRASDQFLAQVSQAQESLLDSEKRYRALFDSNLTGILLSRVDGTMLEANDYFLNLLGMSREVFQTQGINWRAFTAQEDMARSEEAVRETFEKGTSVPFEKSYLRVDGSRVPVLIGLAKVDAGRLIAYVMDLTERKAYEKQLADSSARLEERVVQRTAQLERSQKFLDSIVEYIPNMIFVKDAKDLKFVRFNKAGSQLLGFSQRELLGKGDQDFFPPEQALQFIAKDREVLQGKVVIDIAEEPIRTQSGLRYLHTKKIPILDQDGNPEYLLGISEDITDRKENENQRARFFQEQAARMSAEKTAAEMVFMSDVSAVLTETLDLPTVLDAFALKITGHMADWCEIALLDEQRKNIQYVAVASRDPEKKKGLAAWRAAHPEDPSTGLGRVMKTGEAELYVDLSGVPEAQSHPAVRDWGLRSAMIVPIRVSGRTIGAIGFSMAESGRLYQEIDLSVAQDLARRAFFTIENARLFDQAQESNRAKSAFLANVSHEIRTPLGAMLGFAELLLDEKSLQPRLVGNVETILRNGRQLLHIVDEILDITKVESGGISIEPQPFSVSNLLDEVVNLLSGMAGDKGLQLIVKRKSFLPDEAVSDPSRLRQILINVVGNAIKFTEKGQVELRVDLRPGLKSQHQTLVIEVNDTGIGIAPEQSTRLFNAFTQADNSMTRRFGGTGLGLFLARRLARLLGGDVVLQQSVPGEGSSFVITIDLFLPSMVVKPSVSIRPAQAPAAPVPGRGTVLVVDDSPDNRELVAHYLTRLGFQVDTAAGGAEALEKSKGATFQVVLMDLQMPGMDGFETLRELRKLNYPGPIVALTAHAMKGDRERCLEAGFDDYLCKPIDRRALSQTLDRFAESAPAH